MRPYLFDFARGKMFAIGCCLAVGLAMPGCAELDRDDGKVSHAAGDGKSQDPSSDDSSRAHHSNSNTIYNGLSDQSHQVEDHLNSSFQ